MQDSPLHPSGLFNPVWRFSFTNISSEDFTSYWNSRPVTIKAGQTVKLKHHLAVKFTKELVDKIIQGEAKLDEINFYKNNPNTQTNMYRSPKGSDLGIPAIRKVYEDQICKQLPNEDDAVEMEVLKDAFVQEILNDSNKQRSSEPVAVPATVEPGKLPEAFAELKK